MTGIDTRWGNITLAPPEATTAMAASTEMKGKNYEAVATTFLGRRMGIPMTPKTLGGRGRTALLTTG